MFRLKYKGYRKKNAKISKTTKELIILLSKYGVPNNKKTRFIK